MSNSQSRDVFARGGAGSVATASPGTSAASGLKLGEGQEDQSAQPVSQGGAEAPCLLRICPRRFPSTRRGHQRARMLSGGRVTDRHPQACPGIRLPHTHTRFTCTCSRRRSSPLPAASPPPVPPLQQDTAVRNQLRRSGGVLPAHWEGRRQTGRRGSSRARPAARSRAAPSATGSRRPESRLI